MYRWVAERVPEDVERSCHPAARPASAPSPSSLQRHLHLSLGAEVFDWGRVDVDGRVALQLAGRRMEVAVKGLALGLGQPGARHLYSGELRWRFASRLYALAQGGTRLSPRADGTLRPVVFAAFGLGVDHAR